MSDLLFKQAETEAELQQIHAFNHRVFAEEIAQHHAESSGLLIDRLHNQNTYFIAVRHGKVIGMISAHSGPEFSITKRLTFPAVLQVFPRPYEIRLLAIEPNERNRIVLTGLLYQSYNFGLTNGFTHMLISGITDRQPMYRKMGFVPLGPPVPEGAASFIPMALDLRENYSANPNRFHAFERRVTAPNLISLMPGPVAIHPDIAAAFAKPLISHRSADFIKTFEQVRNKLSEFIPGTQTVLLPGAGTLANDAVAANLKAIFGNTPGLVLSNGVFGDRLINHASAAGLNFHPLPWSFDQIEQALKPEIKWIWAVHLETSTGVLNDVEKLLTYNRPVILDCVSSLGSVTIPNSAQQLLMATTVSGKSLGAYAGIAIVYLSHLCRELLNNKPLCPTFNLLAMSRTQGPQTTISSAPLFALAKALDLYYTTPDRFQHYRDLGILTRQRLRQAGLAPLAPEATAAPNITTFHLPSADFPQTCLHAGFQIAHQSGYLQENGWAQIATMGNITTANIETFFRSIHLRSSTVSA